MALIFKGVVPPPPPPVRVQSIAPPQVGEDLLKALTQFSTGKTGGLMLMHLQHKDRSYLVLRYSPETRQVWLRGSSHDFGPVVLTDRELRQYTYLWR